MTSLLLAAALVAQTPTADWAPKAPYKEKDSAKYSVKMAIEDPASGEKVDVEMVVTYATTKATDKGSEGTFAWTQLMVSGQEQPDEAFTTVLKPNGTLKSVISPTYGDAMRRMLLPFYFTYPEKPVAVGGTWICKDTAEEKVDGHMTDFEYKLVGPEEVKSKKSHKVTVKFNEQGPEPLKGDGTYWIGEDGRVLKFELNVSNWTVPVASQAFTAKITGEIAG